MFIDTHCHLNLMTGEPYKFLSRELNSEDLLIIAGHIADAHAASVHKMINVGTSILESWQSLAIAHAYESVFATIGIHPTDCAAFDGSASNARRELLKMVEADKPRRKLVGVGEIGLDFYHKPYDQHRQQDFLVMQIELALEHNLPIVFHVRDAGDEFLRAIEPFVPNKIRGVIHCFQQDQAFADQVIAWNLYVGCDAPITYPKNKALCEVFKNIPLERIILETDAPFLPPQHLRGKQNRPALVPLIAQALADLKSCSIEDIADHTTRNAQSLFGI